MNSAEDVFAIAGVYDVFMRRVEGCATEVSEKKKTNIWHP